MKASFPNSSPHSQVLGRTKLHLSPYLETFTGNISPSSPFPQCAPVVTRARDSPGFSVQNTLDRGVDDGLKVAGAEEALADDIEEVFYFK